MFPHNVHLRPVLHPPLPAVRPPLRYALVDRAVGPPAEGVAGAAPRVHHVVGEGPALVLQPVVPARESGREKSVFAFMKICACTHGKKKYKFCSNLWCCKSITNHTTKSLNLSHDSELNKLIKKRLLTWICTCRRDP